MVVEREKSTKGVYVMFQFSLRNVENCSCKKENCTGATTSAFAGFAVGLNYQSRTEKELPL